MMTVDVTNVAVSHHLTGEAGEQMGRFVLLGAITFAIPGGILWGRVVDRIGPKRTLNIVLALWLATFALASATGLFGLPLVCLWVVAAMAGVAIGGTWSSDRPLMLRLTPPDRVGEFYGLYGMVGRFAAVTGPAAWSIIVPYMITHYQFEAARAEGVGVIALLLMVALSYWILRRVDDTPRDWNALAARPGR